MLSRGDGSGDLHGGGAEIEAEEVEKGEEVWVVRRVQALLLFSETNKTIE